MSEANESEVKEMIKEEFKKADQNGDGWISKEELHDAFEHLGFEEDEFDALYEGADQNGDGRISYNEFVEWVFAVEGAPEGYENEEEASDMESEYAEEEEWPDCESGEEGSDYEDWEGEEEEEWDECGEGYDEEVQVENGDEELPDVGEEPFMDEAFPPTRESLGSTEGDTASGIVGDASGDWIRLHDFCGEERTLFKGINASDVEQGQLGNCWFLAACASVAEYPAWIKQIFEKTPEPRADGLYKVRLFHPGKKAFFYITVSDEVPSNEGAPLFSSPTSSGEMWPCLIEKAFAKFCGNYAQTEGGAPVWGMHYLCGGEGEMWERKEGQVWSRQKLEWYGGEAEKMEQARCNNEGLEEKNGAGSELARKKLWKALMSYSEKNFPMCCSTPNEQEEMAGLVCGHAYSLLTVREVQQKSGKAIQFCKVRNPHGETGWNGKFCDSSDAWEKHPGVRKQLRFKRGTEDGSFWMRFVDFNKYFDWVSVNKRSMPLEGAHEDKVRADKAKKRDKRKKLRDLASNARKHSKGEEEAVAE